ncbi:hypothetical protein AB1Y20_009841 [Prymnesium parvum]|uniref:Uncharacterized protein n=1 Tax=Prymnesium parvum TaxID=97485 RepID=A0AB34K208_PRYPA
MQCHAPTPTLSTGTPRPQAPKVAAPAAQRLRWVPQHSRQSSGQRTLQRPQATPRRIYRHSSTPRERARGRGLANSMIMHFTPHKEERFRFGRLPRRMHSFTRASTYVVPRGLLNGLLDFRFYHMMVGSCPAGTAAAGGSSRSSSSDTEDASSLMSGSEPLRT